MKEEMIDDRKKLRRRLALLTGFFTLRQEIDGDIAELMGHVEDAGYTSRDPGTSLVNGTGHLALPAPEEPLKMGMSPAEKKRKSQLMKARWEEHRQSGKAGRLETGEVTEAPVAPPKSGRGRPRKDSRLKKKDPGPMIGFLTNAAYIYEWAIKHGGTLDVKQAQADSAKSQHHKNLMVDGRITVAIAEMKRKGLLVHAENQKGIYYLTPLATEIYNKERQ